MTGSPTYQHLTLEALEEHRQVHFYLDQLMRMLAEVDRGVSSPDSTGDPSIDPAPEPMRRLAAELGSLIERLTEHFEAEESGLYHGVVDLLPHLGTEVRRLSEQHARLLETLELARIHAERAASHDLAALRADLEAFLHVLRRHEQAEEEILVQALETDGGV